MYHCIICIHVSLYHSLLQTKLIINMYVHLVHVSLLCCVPIDMDDERLIMCNMVSIKKKIEKKTERQ